WGILSIFFDNSKYFYGNFDNSTFELIANTNFSSSFYILKGTYKKTEENLIVNYSFEPIGKFIIAWIKYFPIIALIMFNYILYFEEKKPMEMYIVCNLFIIFISIIFRLNLKWQNKKLKRKFNKIFEITD
ncbi:MAG: hypothetical protein K2P85_12030, partial [Flavobacteriaceae bacterium]|nr:hypothetical protein [Flavobacteriaceae bacterium]